VGRCGEPIAGFGPGTEVAEPHQAACGRNAAFGRSLRMLLGGLDATGTSTEHTTCPVRRSSSGRPLRHVGRLADAPQVLPLRGSRSASAECHKPRLVAAPTFLAGEPWHSGPHSRYPSSSFFTNLGNAIASAVLHRAIPHGRACWSPAFDARRPEKPRRPLSKPEAHTSSLQSRELALTLPCRGRFLVCRGHSG
jgi:hypothetical protein